jgi:hypothetical protein
VSGRLSASAVRALPPRANLEHLKNQARSRLRELRGAAPAARLADAQLQVARDYGFSSWRELKAFVDARADPFAGLVGFYRHDPRDIANSVSAVTSEGGRLFLERSIGGRFELVDDGQGRFVIAGLPGWHEFERADDGPATAMVSRADGQRARAERISRAEAEAILASRRDAEAEQLRPRLSVAVAPEILQRYVGHYAARIGARGTPPMEIACQGGQLTARIIGQPALDVFPESETRFFYRVAPAQLSFVLEGGRAVALVVHQHGIGQRMDRVSADDAAGASAQILQRLAEQQRPRSLREVDPALFARYAGRYRIDAGRTLTVTAEGGRLYIEITGQPRFEVYPEGEGTFFWTIVAAQITFVDDTAGEVSHAVLHQNGRDTPLPRLPGAGAVSNPATSRLNG